MSEFQSMKEDILAIERDITSMLNNFTMLSSSEIPAKMKRIEDRFNDLNNSLTEMEEQIMMFDSSEKNEAKKFILQTKNEIQKLESQYKDVKAKGSQRDALFGNSQLRSDGTSTGQLNSLIDQNQLIEEGNSLTNELARGAAAGKEAGMGILAELGKQRSTIDHIDDELDTLDTDVETGDRMITKMLCRNKRRTIFMVAVIIILIIAIALFLYFIFK